MWPALPFLLLGMPLRPGQSGVSTERPMISVDVNLVMVRVTVCDRKGEFVPGLSKEDFHVFEDGQPQTIRLFQHEDMPVSVGLVVDNSTSMAPKRPGVVLAALEFIHSSNPRDEMFVVNFNERVSLGLPPTQLFSTGSSQLIQALNGVPARGKTALYDAIENGLAHLRKASRQKKVLIVISDGGDNASRHKLPQVIEDAERSDVVIYTIGLFDDYDEDRNPGVLTKLARATGGEVFLPSESGKVGPICKRIAEDIRHQYTIGYAPSDPKLDNTYRTIRVKVTRPHGGGVLVRTRAGYIASPLAGER